ncbi:unnamed protein product [Lampetra fluviatilis]
MYSHALTPEPVLISSRRFLPLPGAPAAPRRQSVHAVCGGSGGAGDSSTARRVAMPLRAEQQRATPSIRLLDSREQQQQQVPTHRRSGGGGSGGGGRGGGGSGTGVGAGSQAEGSGDAFGEVSGQQLREAEILTEARKRRRRQQQPRQCAQAVQLRCAVQGAHRERRGQRSSHRWRVT